MRSTKRFCRQIAESALIAGCIQRSNTTRKGFAPEFVLCEGGGFGPQEKGERLKKERRFYEERITALALCAIPWNPASALVISFASKNTLRSTTKSASRQPGDGTRHMGTAMFELLSSLVVAETYLETA